MVRSRLSSMRRGAPARVWLALVRLFQSVSVSRPVRTRVEGDVGFGGEEALAELQVGHFEAEEEDGAALVGGGVAGDVEGEGGFADGGAGAEDDEVAGLEAGELGVEVDEAGGEAGAGVAGAAEGFDVVEAFGEELVEGEDGVGEDVLADGEDQ